MEETRLRDWDHNDRHACGDCSVYEGQLHQPGCDMERCPLCRGQLISCGCCYKQFYPSYRPLESMSLDELKVSLDRGDTNGLPREVYENGLPEHQQQEWDRLLEAKGRIPHVVSPNLCGRCGQLWPEMFHAADWSDVIPAPLAQEILCQQCYELIRSFVLIGRDELAKETV